MRSERLSYHLLEPARLDDFHSLVQDEHVRRYMLDGNLFPREWSLARVRESQVLFERRGVGIWLAYDGQTGELVGFCGFEQRPEHPQPRLVYALFERYCGSGLATEMALAAMAEARRHPSFEWIYADVDEVNTASLRILQKLGFERVEVQRGAFGNLLLLRSHQPEPLPST